MEEILKRANELSLLLKKTKAFSEFESISKEVESDPDASALLKKYNEIAETIQRKYELNSPIESYEKEMFRSLTEVVVSNELLRKYIKARDQYMELLLKIYEEIKDIT